jgi:membrane protein YqaA with SNARE-associated domain
MALFTHLYDACLRWSRHPAAPRYLAGLSFAESSFFPIPPDVMLMPMSLAQPHRAMYFAGLTTAASVLGGVAGYAIGHFAIDWVAPLIETGGRWAAAYATASHWFAQWGFWAVLIAGFSPIPYVPFILASAVGRGARFFLVAGLLAWGGSAMEARMRRYIDRVGWALVTLGVAAYIAIKL